MNPDPHTAAGFFYPQAPLAARPPALVFGHELDTLPENVAALLAAYEGRRPDLGEIRPARLSDYWIDRIPPGARPLPCPVCRRTLTATKAGDFTLAAVFTFRADKLPGLNAVATFTLCPACARTEAPALAAEIAPA